MKTKPALTDRRRIHINIGRTVNLGDYESARVDLGMSETIEDIDTAEDVFAALFEQLNERLDVCMLILEDENSNKRKKR